MSDLLKSIDGGVMVLTMNRPQAMNALSPGMMNDMHEVLQDAAHDPEIGAVVLRGAGDKAFCAGGDVKTMAAGGRMQGASHETKAADLQETATGSRIVKSKHWPHLFVV